MTTKTYGATGTGSSGQIQYFTAGTAGNYAITAAGAQGGAGVNGRPRGGLGATASGDIYLAKGAKLEIVVGQQGSNGSAGGGGGGGGSFVIEYDNATSAYDIDEVIAGGGGGGGGYATAGGGGTTKGSGQAGMGGKSTGGGGGGGFTGGKGAGFDGTTGRPGSDNATTFAGGPGASGTFGFSTGFHGGDGGFGGGGGAGASGGGGGGGYGGGHGGGPSSGGGGGGGGSYVNPDATNAEQTPGSSNGHTGNGFVKLAMVCFVTGTRIRTARGDIAVEHLAVGDRVITASGALRPIRWIGQRTIDCRRHPSPHDAHPVRISAHAFAPNQPARDLFLSSGHPVLVGADADHDGGHLVPVMCLINGTTVRRDAVDTVTYWHVELDAHDILLAENLPAESYIDLGSRPWFAGADGALYDPDMALPGMPGRCRPVAIDGPVVEAERRRLDGLFAMRLAAACAWPNLGDGPHVP